MPQDVISSEIDGITFRLRLSVALQCLFHAIVIPYCVMKTSHTLIANNIGTFYIFVIKLKLINIIFNGISFLIKHNQVSLSHFTNSL